MANIPADPLGVGGIARFADEFRTQRTSSESATAAYLARIEALDGRLGAYEHVARDGALAQARALDALLAAGTDLGQLMGVPVAIKDLIAVEGMPTTAGSNVDVEDLIGPEGTFVGMLKRAGCVILGKVKTAEFARSGHGVNQARGTPWNPWDAATHRIPGGSSSGSGVAVAAGLCGFAIGSDTGGSVRQPACFNGTFGWKTTKGLWPTDGVFALSPTLDTLGPLTRSAADAAIVCAALADAPVPAPHPARGLLLGKPEQHFYADLDAETEFCTAGALAALEDAGVTIVNVSIPEVAEQLTFYPGFITPEFLGYYGRDRYEATRERLDPFTLERTERGIDTPADEYIRLLWRHRQLCEIARERLRGLDGWITPTTAFTAPPVSYFLESADAERAHARIAQNAHTANLFGLCATTTPIHAFGSDMPVGLQVMCAGGEDRRALSIALLLEDVFGPPPTPDLSAFA